MCIENDSIAVVSTVEAGIPPSFQGSPLIETGGTIYPGLIELHNHPAYNAIPLWNVPTQYLNRGGWRSAPQYKRKVANPATLLTHHPQEIYPKSVARYVECRALLGGVTTSQGLTLSDEQLVRMVTTVPAKMMGWDGYLGSVEKGKQADLLIIGKADGDPYSTFMYVANQYMVLDLIDDPTQPLAKLTPQGSMATLSHALEHMPELAKTFQAGHAELPGAPSKFRIQLEMDEFLALDAISGAVTINPGDVDPMELDGITGVDDGTFVQRLRSNLNLPQWLGAAL